VSAAGCLIELTGGHEFCRSVCRRA